MQYKVQTGDTLSKIASDYGMKWQDLYNYNKSTIGSNPNLIRAGVALNIPGQQPAPQSNTQAPTQTPNMTSPYGGTGAQSYAEQHKQEILNDLNSMFGGQEELRQGQISESEARRDRLLGQIDANRQPVEQDYQNNARQAFVSKQLGGQQLGEQLGRMGLSQSGFGLGQQMGLANAHSQQLNQLQTTKQELLQNLTNMGLDVEREHLENVSSIDLDYASRMLELEKYINERAQQGYDTAYERYVQEKMYNDATAEAKRVASLKSAAGGAGGTSSSNFNSLGKYVGAPTSGTNPYGKTKGLTEQARQEYGTFSNGYQPKGIVGSGLLSKSGQKLSSLPGGDQLVGSTGVPLGNQNVWKTNDGKFWIWDGSIDEYIDITSVVRQNMFNNIKIPSPSNFPR